MRLLWNWNLMCAGICVLVPMCISYTRTYVCLCMCVCMQLVHVLCV